MSAPSLSSRTGMPLPAPTKAAVSGRDATIAVAELVSATDGALEALNAATTVFDQVGRAKSETLMKELAGIVESIQTVAREAKVVSFNAQVMAARAGQHGREFAVVANVLSDITQEIDGLSLQAVSLAGRSRSAA